VIRTPQPVPAPSSTPVPLPPPPAAPVIRTRQPATSPASPLSPEALRSRLATADAALSNGDLTTARSGYAELVDTTSLDHATALHLGENLYEAGDYRNAVRAFQRVGAFRPGEEPQRYTFALALYETGNYREAKRELSAALPKLEETPEVLRNRAKIEGAIE